MKDKLWNIKIIHRDLLGQELKIGDYIVVAAVAHTYSTTSTLRLDVGVVTGFDKTGNSIYYYPCRLVESDGTVWLTVSEEFVWLER